MEKIKKFNQYLLAAFGILAIVLLFGFGILGLIDTIRYSSSSNNQEVGIISDKQAKELGKDSLRNQVISFQSPMLLDSTNNIFLLPVGQAYLGKTELNEDLLGLMNVSQSYSRNRYSFNNTYNNLIIFGPSISQRSLFNERISISAINPIKLEEKTLLIIYGTNQDSKADGILNAHDLQDVYVYEIENNQLVKIDVEEGFTAQSLFQLQNSNQLILSLGLDRDKDGFFNSGNEPTFHYYLDNNDYSITPIVSEEEVNRLQRLLEGSPN